MTRMYDMGMRKTPNTAPAPIHADRPRSRLKALHGMVRRAVCTILLACLLAPAASRAEALCVTQADGGRLCLDRPPERILSLAPHVTEMLFAVGAQARIAGVVAYSDFPPEARALPNIGSYHALDLERVLALRPDLVIAWAEGNAPAQLDRLRALGLPIWSTPGRRFADVPAVLRDLGRLTGNAAQAETLARDFEGEVQALTEAHRTLPPLRGFYEIWPSPLVTVGPEHFISEAMTRCGIANLVDASLGDTPTWSEEAVIRARPHLIITSPPARDFERWKRWKDLPAVQGDGLIVLPPDVLMRPGPRLVEGLRALCAAADAARKTP